jgi:hypothetical protein
MARQVADQRGRGAVTVPRGRKGEEDQALVDFAVHGLKGDLFPKLMDLMWDGGCPQGEVMWGRENAPIARSRGGVREWVWSIAARFARRVTWGPATWRSRCLF